ncbi:hypothetical protein, unlikely [Trypanosoma congolense IL3000]|uniref:Uncharacterized protein n=1 Tax=Trypanosoma congolense (strain IL3000) TaxID=1068625 RepID=F9WF64_TRYCI|nr:hypothetical protein, unlikely [Trypanosoma congolense IL3000]
MQGDPLSAVGRIKTHKAQNEELRKAAREFQSLSGSLDPAKSDKSVMDGVARRLQSIIDGQFGGENSNAEAPRIVEDLIRVKERLQLFGCKLRYGNRGNNTESQPATTEGIPTPQGNDGQSKHARVFFTLSPFFFSWRCKPQTQITKQK